MPSGDCPIVVYVWPLLAGAVCDRTSESHVHVTIVTLPWLFSESLGLVQHYTGCQVGGSLCEPPQRLLTEAVWEGKVNPYMAY